MNFSSRLLENAVNEIAQLPGIGKRTALRLALHLIKLPKENTMSLTQSLDDLRDQIKFCSAIHLLILKHLHPCVIEILAVFKITFKKI